MSKLVAFAAIQGGYNIVQKAEGIYKRALEEFGPDQKLEFPNTAYYLPINYSLLGIPIKTLGDAKKCLEVCRKLLPPHIKSLNYLPYLGPLLDAGMAAILAEEIVEGIKYIREPDFYTVSEETDPENGKLWLGAAEDTIFRKRGVSFVDGSAPGFVAIVGAAPSPEIAKEIALEYQRRSIYVFMCANQGGTTFSEQLVEAGVEVGWNTRLVPYGPDISAAVYALGFANRVAMGFGGVTPGDYRRVLLYNKDRVFAFVNALGEVNAEWAANAAGCVNWGFPTLADTDIPEILPTGVCTYEHVVANVPLEEMVQRSVEVRGLKTTVATVDIPLAYGPAFEGERIRRGDMYCEMGGSSQTPVVEWVTSAPMDQVEDGKVVVIGPDIADVKEGGSLPLGIKIIVAGRKFQEDFEPILERQIHHLINYAQGLMHTGQRDIGMLRVSKDAVAKGFTIRHLGVILHAKLHQDFGAVFDKLQVEINTETEKAEAVRAAARKVYVVRDARVENMTDETTEIYYSCTLCQSFAPNHVCVVSPERTGLCGAYNWMDCKASFEINQTGPNQPIDKGETLDPVLGIYKGANDFIAMASRQAVTNVCFYSMVNDPMTTCGCCECIAAILPSCNGLMTVNRDYTGETPSGMKFSTLAGSMGGGNQTPGFVGHSKYNVIQRKFLVGDGGLLRLVWMPTSLKEELREKLLQRGEELGYPNLIDRIADETIGLSEEEILPHLEKMEHPALTMPSIFG
ncbi:MAG: CO dehydrogenase/CO-methylating acetyl-CoA synthase complex subunit beta [Deltaproteobacteria bacterium]|jgi:acetyl-CoA synthase|nr:CO dehydrogenase/CO-methylating acetyl-CoA synthase complex subunit beta [Deltaproteobacteria bacterium]